MNLSLLVLLSTILCAPSAALAQTVSPESLGLSSERLERVAELMQRQIDERIFSGAVTLVACAIPAGHAQSLIELDNAAQTVCRASYGRAELL